RGRWSTGPGRPRTATVSTATGTRRTCRSSLRHRRPAGRQARRLPRPGTGRRRHPPQVAGTPTGDQALRVADPTTMAEPARQLANPVHQRAQSDDLAAELVAAALPAPGRFDAARVEAAVRELLI